MPVIVLPHFVAQFSGLPKLNPPLWRSTDRSSIGLAICFETGGERAEPDLRLAQKPSAA